MNLKIADTQKRGGLYRLPEEPFVPEEQKGPLSSKRKSRIQTVSSLGCSQKSSNLVSMIPSFVLELGKKVVRESFELQFGVEHRLEQIAVIEGVEYWNDSKATNVNSVWFALDSINKPIIWITGGQDKGNDYTSLFGLVKEKVKGIVCLAKDSSKIKQAFSGIVPVFFETESMEEAVAFAGDLSLRGDAIVLSPGCASFDLFENYEDRGRQFKNAVRSL
jgi:UDP-N-acetylmuramoylalanine--D-glutamate ligase